MAKGPKRESPFEDRSERIFNDALNQTPSEEFMHGKESRVEQSQVQARLKQINVEGTCSFPLGKEFLASREGASFLEAQDLISLKEERQRFESDEKKSISFCPYSECSFDESRFYAQ